MSKLLLDCLLVALGFLLGRWLVARAEEMAREDARRKQAIEDLRRMNERDARAIRASRPDPKDGGHHG